MYKQLWIDLLPLRKRFISPKFDELFESLELDDVFESLPQPEGTGRVVAVSAVLGMTPVDAGLAAAWVVRVH